MLKNEKNKGITLIALVVTVIVLLILAAVSIQMLTGDNGIITNASKVSTSNAYKSAEEQVKLAYMAVKAEISAKTVKSGTYDPTVASETTALATIVENDLGANQTGSKWAVDGSIAGTIKITYTDSKIDKDSIGTVNLATMDGTTVPTVVPREEGKVHYKIRLLKSQDAELFTDISDDIDTGDGVSSSEISQIAEKKTTPADKISTYKDYYGKVVDYQVQLTTSLTNSSGANKGKWKIFYADGNNIYLITDSRIAVPSTITADSKFPNNGITRASDWNAKFGGNTSSGIYASGKYTTGVLNDSSNTNSNGINILKYADITTLKKLNNSYYNEKSFTGNTNPNSIAVASMLDTSSWEMFRDSKYAQYAIGGPSVEMFCDSYTQTHPQGYGLKAEAFQNGENYGYKVKTTATNASYGWNTAAGSVAAYDDTSADTIAATAINQLYRPDSTSTSTEHFWLSSPSDNNANRVVIVDCNFGYVNRDYYYYADYGFRPLVCLKSDVQLVEASGAKKDQGIDFELR